MNETTVSRRGFLFLFPLSRFLPRTWWWSSLAGGLSFRLGGPWAGGSTFRLKVHLALYFLSFTYCNLWLWLMSSDLCCVDSYLLLLCVSLRLLEWEAVCCWYCDIRSIDVGAVSSVVVVLKLSIMNWILCWALVACKEVVITACYYRNK